jgi:hypothetical protein
LTDFRLGEVVEWFSSGDGGDYRYKTDPRYIRPHVSIRHVGVVTKINYTTIQVLCVDDGKERRVLAKDCRHYKVPGT